MDPFKLLTRSTGFHLRARAETKVAASSDSQKDNARPQRSPRNLERPSSPSRKRKRGQAMLETSGQTGIGFDSLRTAPLEQVAEEVLQISPRGLKNPRSVLRTESVGTVTSRSVLPSVPILERKRVLRELKLKLTHLNPSAQPGESRRKKQGDGIGRLKKHEKPQLFPKPLLSFDELRDVYSVSRRLTDNINEQGYIAPTEVQTGSLPLLLDLSRALPDSVLDGDDFTSHQTLGVDLLTVAPTGSGKTLAFLIPTLQAILDFKHRASLESTEQARRPLAIILAPTKELAGQIVNESRKLAKGTGVHVTLMRKGMRLEHGSEEDHGTEVDGDEAAEDGHATPNTVKADALVSTPGALLGDLQDKVDGVIAISCVRYFVLDEADVLLDPLFREQTLAIWRALTNLSLRVSLWSATMGSNIESLAQATINERRERLSAPEARLIRLVVGLKDSAVPNIQHRLIYAGTEQGKLMGLRQLLHPSFTSTETGPALQPPFLVFTQTIERAAALHAELLYDIPAEAGGIDRIAVLHSDLSDIARDRVMGRFRNGEIWVLITTDLLSRGVDFRGINAVVNYDIPSSSAAYVHRVGRTGRAGREGGVAVTLYTKEDIPYIKHVANVIAISERNGGTVQVEGEGVAMPTWLLDALPKVSKKEKRHLKSRGVEARATRSGQRAKRSTISTKSGYVRRLENDRKSAVAASRERNWEGTNFGGFD